ncbi:MAG: ABC transporter substrate-binding protein [Chloroflexota bacterium]|nr:ABC transporter substrate-binding protein [Chloroflexota bacterium]
MSKTRMGILSLIILMLTALPLINACGGDEEVTATETKAVTQEPATQETVEPEGDVEILVGGLWDFSGPYASQSKMLNQGYQDRIDWFNKQEEIPGVKIKQVTHDTGQKMDRSMAGYEKFKAGGCVEIHTSVKGESLALKDLLAQDRIPNLSLNSDMALARPQATTYMYYAFHTDQLAAVLDHMKAKLESEGKGPAKLFIIAMDTPTGRPSVAEHMMDWYEEQGIEVVGSAFIPVVPTDTSTELLRAKEAGANMISGIMVGPTFAVLLRDYYKLGFDPEETLIGSINPTSPSMQLQIAGKATKGAYISWANWIWGEDTPGANFVKEVQLGFHDEEMRDDNYCYGFSMADTLVEVFKLALDKTPASELTGDTLLKFGFDRLENYDSHGIQGVQTFGDERLGSRQIRMLRGTGEGWDIEREWYDAPQVGWE